MYNPLSSRQPAYLRILTSEQIGRIISVIEQDATGRKSLISLDPDDNTVYCVIGGLGKELGMTDEQLSASDADMEGICSKYGLTHDHIQPLYMTNDAYHGVGARRYALIELVKSWARPS